MSTQDAALDLAEAAPVRWRRYGVLIGRVLLIALLLVLWKVGADIAGPLYAADPIKVFQRTVADVQSGTLLRHIYVTLRLSLIGFALACVAGVVLPFVLRRMPRLTAAVEPYIMASVGIPKYALIPLFILYFGIDDAPKLWLIGLLVFYPIFIAVFAGIRNVDRRLINMARVVGAGEFVIAREVIWNSLLPFFFAALKIALPRAISAAIIGEFLVGNEGLGFLIENSRQNFDTVGVFEGIAVATALVLVINALLVALDRRVNAWRPVERHMQL
ncbi:MAG TPA: ABC transporter permease [Xanthobacteraceae bacterium]|nr:ABC transporter permease [Xanthobacteraceae bacterium]